MFTNCNKNSEKEKQSKGATEQTKESTDELKEEASSEVSNYDLLQGKWQHTEDKTNFVVFENNLRKEIAAGMDEWDSEEFVLSDKCLNDFNKDNKTEGEKDRYITCKASDLCWYILELNETTLSLSYMGRGNTLNYKKVQ
ncbi:MAG: hypothetical protein A2W91_01385 [Bacteroidetes bacterium GWF2_38_335]|nr:MAG: hypothetical protein A2W91_01385 [Bacteroidetes bacterium GWF2_38_335]OFY80949.1 MAG: hypothetical protein A2281_12880 [Bacteroidetes bacterium RIFOXYA12_FULL_38_20]HBS85116.1 hypothetical protein [Bacteroidales bacterium]